MDTTLSTAEEAALALRVRIEVSTPEVTLEGALTMTPKLVTWESKAGSKTFGSMFGSIAAATDHIANVVRKHNVGSHRKAEYDGNVDVVVSEPGVAELSYKAISAKHLHTVLEMLVKGIMLTLPPVTRHA